MKTPKEWLLEQLNGFEGHEDYKEENINAIADFMEHYAKYYHEQVNSVDLAVSVVRSVFTIHSTQDEGIIKIVGTEDEAKQQVEEFKKQHSYADFFYEKQNVS